MVCKPLAAFTTRLDYIAKLVLRMGFAAKSMEPYRKGSKFDNNDAIAIYKAVM